ncbi:MAG: hypothetical protein QOE45_3494 [Frankiaceae bacterium]|nr:hypothetical protein [Frankiaceae bacterium]
MRRREFIAGGLAAAWPVATRAQQLERIARISVLTGADAPETDGNMPAFLQALQQLGWTEGLNLRVDMRRGDGDAEQIRRHAVEMAALAPNVILTSGTASMGPVLQATRVVPIVFVNVADPVGAGFVSSLSRPGGNATGFVQFEYSLSGKWMELLKQMAPSVTRAAVLRDAAITSGIGQFAVIQAVAPSIGIEVSPINVRDSSEMTRAVATFTQAGDGGLIVTASALSAFHRDLIVSLAARHKLPAVYYRRLHVDRGGLMSYGP